MHFNHTLSAVLRGQWFLNRGWADAHIPLVLSMLNGSPVSFVERTGSAEMELPFALEPKSMQRHALWVYDNNYRLVPNPNIPQGSVGILPMTGPITKYNGECGEPGAVAKNTWVMDMQKRANISSIVMLADTPGGEARAASTLTTTIKNSKKPILTFVDGMSASLGMFYLSASREVYLGDAMSEVGSIGTYCSILDFSGYLEMNGIKVHEIYAPQSTDKNKEYRDVLAGDETAMKGRLESLTSNFINTVKTNRPAAAAKETQWNTGRMFQGKEAVKVGLAEGIMPFDKVVARAAFLANH